MHALSAGRFPMFTLRVSFTRGGNLSERLTQQETEGRSNFITGHRNRGEHPYPPSNQVAPYMLYLSSHATAAAWQRGQQTPPKRALFCIAVYPNRTQASWVPSFPVRPTEAAFLRCTLPRRRWVQYSFLRNKDEGAHHSILGVIGVSHGEAPIITGQGHGPASPAQQPARSATSSRPG